MNLKFKITNENPIVVQTEVAIGLELRTLENCLIL